jgi:hypothetical protein
MKPVVHYEIDCGFHCWKFFKFLEIKSYKCYHIIQNFLQECDNCHILELCIVFMRIYGKKSFSIYAKCQNHFQSFNFNLITQSFLNETEFFA